MISSYGNNSGPLVSVLISTYNRPRYVAEAVESILRQTYTNFEILLVRDGGKEVADVISRFDDPRLTFIDRSENKGIPYSFNEALSMAKGKYICYLGDDDIFYPFHIETLVNAIEGQDEYGVVYSDLYKAHCRVEEDGSRTVLSKNVEISRDFDRTSLYRFNNMLHVSIIHRRDLFERAGGYNEELNVLIDWDMTRKLSFYTKFKHIYEITGEYYAPVGDCDRVSVQRRKNTTEFLMNFCKIRNTRPPKPWNKVKDLSIIIPAEHYDVEVNQTLKHIWLCTYYPHRIFVTLPHSELDGIRSFVPFSGVGVDANSTMAERINKAVGACDGEYVAVVPPGFTIENGNDERPWIETALEPMLNGSDAMTAYELLYSDDNNRAAVLRREQLVSARANFGHLGWYESALSIGLKFKKPVVEEFPLQFDCWISEAEDIEGQGDWARASQIFDYLREKYQNELWMKTRCANALYHNGEHKRALQMIREVNRERPAVSGLLIEARAHAKQNDFASAIDIFNKAERILEGSELSWT